MFNGRYFLSGDSLTSLSKAECFRKMDLNFRETFKRPLLFWDAVRFIFLSHGFNFAHSWLLGTLGTAILTGIFQSLSEQKNTPPSPSFSTEQHYKTPTRFIACVNRSSSAERLEATLQPLIPSSAISLRILHSNNLSGVQSADVVILACKPQLLEPVLSEPGVAAALSGKLLISILAGVPVTQIEEILSQHTARGADHRPCRVVRVMPNTAAFIRESMTVIATSTPPLPKPLDSLVTWIFTRIGRVVRLPPAAMDVSTALCGSGPAFFALMLEAMADGAVAMGLPRDEAREMAAQSMKGCAGMVLNGEHPAMLREKVSTPGGCTIGGLLVLEEGRVRGTLARGVREATVVAAQLGKGVQGVNGTRF